MKTNDLKSLSDDDLLLRRAEVTRQLTLANFQLRTGQLEDTSRLGKMRGAIARMNTELRSRESLQSLQKGTLLNRSVALKSPSQESSGESAGEQPVVPRSRFSLSALRERLLGRES